MARAKVDPFYRAYAFQYLADHPRTGAPTLTDAILAVPATS